MIAQAIMSGDYLHKQNSFLIHVEQANSRTGMVEPYSTLSIRNDGLVSIVVGILDNITTSGDVQKWFRQARANRPLP